MRYLLENKQKGTQFEFIIYDDLVTIVKMEKDNDPVLSPHTKEEARKNWHILVSECDYERVSSKGHHHYDGSTYNPSR